MRLLTDPLTYLPGFRTSRQNRRLLVLLILVSFVLVVLYSFLFKVIMRYEGQEHSWITAFYWTTTNMSTLGLGDIAFRSDLGRAFTIVVHGSGIVILLILIPFVFLQFFQSSARVPRELPPGTRGHIVLTNYGPLTSTLVRKLRQYRFRYAVVVEDLAEALRLHDLGLSVVIGDLHNPDTFRSVAVEQAALVATTGSDQLNTNIIYTVRELSAAVPIISIADEATSVEVLRTAGSTHVIRLAEMMGQSLARRIHGADAMAHIVGQVDELLIAEATAAGTPVVGKTLEESRFREVAGITVVGMWERGEFESPRADSRINPNTVLLLAGSQDQIDRYNELFCIYHVSDAPVVIVGGGRVGKATGRALDQRGIDHRFVEQFSDRARGLRYCIIGNALETRILEEAGIRESPEVVITTHNDDTNIFLTTFCRQIRPDIQIFSRATQETNVRTLHRAGADFVISFASMGANAIFNVLQRGKVLMVTEGLDVFKVRVTSLLAGKTIGNSMIRQGTGCSVIAVRREGNTTINPDPDLILHADEEVVLIGTAEGEERFLDRYPQKG